MTTVFVILHNKLINLFIAKFFSASKRGIYIKESSTLTKLKNSIYKTQEVTENLDILTSY